MSRQRNFLDSFFPSRKIDCAITSKLRGILQYTSAFLESSLDIMNINEGNLVVISSDQFSNQFTEVYPCVQYPVSSTP